MSHEDLFRSLKEFCGRDLLFLEKPNPNKPKRSPSKELYQLKDWLIAGEEGRKKGYLNQDAFLSAYASFFVPLYLPEIYSILQTQLDLRKIAPRPARKLLDVGAGLGTATLSYLIWCQDNQIELPEEITLIDLSRKALKQAEVLIKTISPKSKIFSLRIDLRNPVEMNRFFRSQPRRFDLTMISHTLYEMGSGPRVRPHKLDLIEKFLSYSCHPEGDMIVVEPSSRGASMDLMAMRDSLFDNGALVVAPCPAQTAFCPMLRARAGSCHTSPPRKLARERGLAPWDKEMMRFLGIDTEASHFSYLWLQPSQETGKQIAHQHFVLVSDSRSKRTLLCDGQSLVKGSGPYRGAPIMAAIPAESKPPIKPKVK